MKVGQFTDEQIVSLLQEAAKGHKPITQLCKEQGISEATFYQWRKKFGAMNTREVQRLKELEAVAGASICCGSAGAPVETTWVIFTQEQ